MSLGRLTAVLAGVGVLLVVGMLLWRGVSGSSDIPAAQGAAINHAAPTTTLKDQYGMSQTLQRFRGRVVVLAPFLTLCGEMCPMTTGALLQASKDIDRAGLGSDVALVEVSVDPWRDTPRRLRAYAAMTHLHWTLLTGTHAALSSFWKPFYVWFKRTAPGKPAPVDWLTHRPETMDVAHTNGVFVIDQHGTIRYFLDGPASTGGRLPHDLERLLDAVGRQNLKHPVAPWTVGQLLDDVGRLVHQRIPVRPL
jgi:cytochrome oxidase Cu insertion factor (SCO1/SenC/PrrC family)